ncbi:hypothetical protein [Comamonas composti]|uniref:hypothetical protein n=1 Tax=Comamonas composti TaxID=408558 RepID=UPI00041D0C43|nr:hypothetical protein [Comamonas composti]
MKLSKVALAVAGLMAVATGAVHAGQISSSSSTLAIEVIKSDTQVVAAPSKAYNFAGDVDARTDEQRLQLQYTLDKGQWPVGSGNLITAADALISVNPVTGPLSVNAMDTNNAPITAFPVGTTIDAFVTNNGKTLAFNVTIPVDAANLLKNPIFTLNSLKTLGAGNTGITGLFSVAGETACVAPDTNLDIEFKHYTNHIGAAQLQAGESPDSEHNRQGSTNKARLLNFTQNLKIDFFAAPTSSLTDAQTQNKTFRLNGSNEGNWASLVAAPTNLVAPTAFAGNNNLLHLMGRVKVTQRANGLDTNYVNSYSRATPAATLLAPFVAGDFVTTNPAAANVGAVEFQSFDVTVDLPTVWAQNTKVGVFTTAGVAVGASATVNAAGTQAVIKVTTAADAVALANGAYVWAAFPANTLIPQTSGVTATATIVKSPAGSGVDYSEQNNSCKGSLTGIGGGIKIDVRNYASYATYGDTGPQSLVRVINNSETQNADVYGQIIYASGKYGPWGKLTDLTPRQTLNLSSREIEAKLTNAAASANPFGALSTYTSEAGTAVSSSGPTQGDRLRIVSNTGSTLRVQSFISYPSGVVLDTSNAQGVDFENASNNRTPDNAIDAQPISQDALVGIGK